MPKMLSTWKLNFGKMYKVVVRNTVVLGSWCSSLLIFRYLFKHINSMNRWKQWMNDYMVDKYIINSYAGIKVEGKSRWGQGAIY